jgi:hypothetical protein
MPEAQYHRSQALPGPQAHWLDSDINLLSLLSCLIESLLLAHRNDIITGTLLQTSILMA